MAKFNAMQLNMGKRNIRGKLEKLIEDYKIDILLIQEPCASQIPGGTTLAVAPKTTPIRAKIWFSHAAFKCLKPILLEQLSDTDTCSVAIHVNNPNASRIILCSIYMPSSKPTVDPLTGESGKMFINNPVEHNPLLNEIIIFGNTKNSPVVIATDSNCWHDSWSSSSNPRGCILHEFTMEMDLAILNQGKEITFYKQQVGLAPLQSSIDLTLVTSPDRH
jgi:Endonuclease-reverse transcriptase